MVIDYPLPHLSVQFSRISDRGGGIAKDKLDRVMMYSFTTADESNDALMEDDPLGNMLTVVNQQSSGPMHGYEKSSLFNSIFQQHIP